MVTFNVETDLDIANGARGEIIKIVLDERETAFSASVSIVELSTSIHPGEDESNEGSSNGEPRQRCLTDYSIKANIQDRSRP